MLDLTKGRRVAALGLVLCACLGLAGCGKRSEAGPDITLAYDVAPSPPAKGPATITVILTGADRAPVTGATVKLEGNMSHAGMEPVFRDAAEVEPGRYRAPFEFTMGGDWIVTVTAALRDGGRFEKQFDVRGVKS